MFRWSTPILFKSIRQYSTDRAAWTKEETKKLIDLVEEHGKRWKVIARHFPNRSSSSLTGRYNYLSQKYLVDDTIDFLQDKKRRLWKEEEDQLVMELVGQLGFRWTRIAKYFSDRNSSDVMQRYLRLKEKEEKRSNTIGVFWTTEETEKLRKLAVNHGEDWPLIAKEMESRTASQCEAKYKLEKEQRMLTNKLLEENRSRIEELVEEYGCNDFASIEEMLNVASLDEDKLRQYYWSELDPNIKKGDWTEREVEEMIQMFKELDGSMEFVQRRLFTRRSVSDMWDQYHKYYEKQLKSQINQ